MFFGEIIPSHEEEERKKELRKSRRQHKVNSGRERERETPGEGLIASLRPGGRRWSRKIV